MVQQFHHQHQLTVKMDTMLMRKKEKEKSEKNKTNNMEKGKLQFQILDLSCLSLSSLPKPSLDLATISKLDLSNNNLQVCSYVHICNYRFIEKYLIYKLKEFLYKLIYKKSFDS